MNLQVVVNAIGCKIEGNLKFAHGRVSVKI